MTRHYGNLEDLINVISEDEEEEFISDKEIGPITTIEEEEEIISSSNEEEEEPSTKSSEGELASISLVQNLVLQDEQSTGSDQATLDLVQSLQAEETKNVDQADKEFIVNDENFPPLPSKQ